MSGSSSPPSSATSTRPSTANRCCGFNLYVSHMHLSLSTSNAWCASVHNSTAQNGAVIQACSLFCTEMGQNQVIVLWVSVRLMLCFGLAADWGAAGRCIYKEHATAAKPGHGAAQGLLPPGEWLLSLRSDPVISIVLLMLPCSPVRSPASLLAYRVFDQCHICFPAHLLPRQASVQSLSWLPHGRKRSDMPS